MAAGVGVGVGGWGGGDFYSFYDDGFAGWSDLPALIWGSLCDDFSALRGDLSEKWVGALCALDLLVCFGCDDDGELVWSLVVDHDEVDGLVVGVWGVVCFEGESVAGYRCGLCGAGGGVVAGA